VYQGKRTSEEAMTDVENSSEGTTTTTTSRRRHTTSEDIGWLLDYDPGRRIQRLEFQFHSQHRRKPIESSIAAQWNRRQSSDVYT